MKTYLLPRFVAALITLFAAAQIQAQGRAFTYQGRLTDNAAPAGGIYDIRFTIFDSLTGGASQGGPLTNSATPVSDGLFTVTLDFGVGAFNGANRWLEIAARTNGGGAFTILAPRQAITATPYALTASNLSGTLPATQLTGTLPDARLSGNVSLLGASVDSAEIADGSIVNADISPSAAIADTKLATISTASKVADTALSTNVSKLGASIDSAEITDGTITTNDLNASVLNGTFWKLGGNTGANPTNGNFLGTSDNQPLEFKVNNRRALRLEFVALGSDITANVIAGYHGNSVAAGVTGGTIAGGGTTNINGFEVANRVLASFGTVGGGAGNSVSGFRGTVGGGNGNKADDLHATVAGGGANIASGDSSSIGGGFDNKANGLYGTIPGGRSNVATNRAFAAGTQAKANHQGAFVWADSQLADFASTANNQFLIRASGGVAIGTNDPAGAALRVAGSIKADSYLGMGNTLMLGTTDNQPLEFKVNNQRGLRLEHGASGFSGQSVNVIGGYSGNFASNGLVGATIAGGGTSLTADDVNRVLGDFGTIGGGFRNTAGFLSTVGGGRQNSATTRGSFVGGGEGNSATAESATIGGGYQNAASGLYSVVPGGYRNTATNRAFAAGTQAKANHQGAFVWADSGAGTFGEPDFASTGTNQFLIRASGGVAIGTNDPAGAALRVAGSIKADSLSASGSTLMLGASGGVGINTSTPQGVFGVQVPLSFNNNSATVSILGEDFAPALVMKGGPAPGILRLRNGLEVWPNTNGTSAGYLDVRNTSGTANIVLKGDNGRVGIGTANPASRLHIKQSVDGNNIADSNGGIRLERAGTSSYWQIENWDDNDLIFRHSSGGAFFFIHDTDGTQVISSDKNLKKDIEPLAPMLDRVLALKPVSFRYKPVPETEPPTLGFVAQDVEAVLPDLVKQKGGHKMLTIGGLLPVSIAAIQELAAKVEAGSRKSEDKSRKLEERLQQKETEITELRQRLEKLERLLAPKLAGGAQ